MAQEKLLVAITLELFVLHLHRERRYYYCDESAVFPRHDQLLFTRQSFQDASSKAMNFGRTQHLFHSIRNILICLTSLTRAKPKKKLEFPALCVNCLNSIPEYSRIIDYSIIWMCIWCGLLQKLYKIKKSELLNSKVYSKV